MTQSKRQKHNKTQNNNPKAKQSYGKIKWANENCKENKGLKNKLQESKDNNLKVLQCKDKELKVLESKVSINSKQDKLKNQSSEYHMM